MNFIRTQGDIRRFLDQVNSLHDGYLLSAQFENSGISRGNGLTLDPSKTVLRLRYLVTSICDAEVEIEFVGVREWQIRETQWNEILDSAVSILDDGFVVWTDDESTDPKIRSGCSYVIARTMKWKIL